MCMEKDDKVEKLIGPFKDSAISHLSYERVMLTIDAIVERRIEILKNELNAKIQKLQIEKTFPPKITNEEKVNDEKPCEKSKKEPVHLWFCGDEVTEDKRIKTRNTLKDLFGGVIMTITNKRDVNDNFTYSNSDLKTLKKNIRKYIRNLICTNPEEPLYIYLNRNEQIEKPITCYHTRNYKIIPNSTSNNPWFDIKIICGTYDITIPILFFDRSTYFLSVRNNDSENKTYNFAIVNTKTKEFVIFTKNKFVFDGWKLEITAER